MKNFCNILFIVLFIPACSISHVDAPSYTESVQITPDDSYEECVELVPNQIMHYSFTSSRNVSFNVHYHADESIYYPVNKKGISTWKGSIRADDFDFYTEEQEFFCLMWDNLGDEIVSVTYTYRVDSE